jgi:pilus assembly protein CpaB
LKRSNRLVLLIGIFLAIVAFVGIILISQGQGGGDGQIREPEELPTVVAAADIPLGTAIQANQVRTQTLAVDARAADAFQDPSQVIGQIARQPVTTGQQITNAVLQGGSDPGTVTTINCPATFRCMAVQVDQVTGVGTLIKTGDYVDMVVGFTGEKFPVIAFTDQPVPQVLPGINPTSVKLLLQGMQVLGTLLPPPPEQTGGEEQPEQEPGTALNEQQEIVILAVTPQQAEVIKFAQLDGSVSLILRSADDFVDPTTNTPIVPVPDATTGIILKTLVDSYGVLPPELVETVLPAQENP